MKHHFRAFLALILVVCLFAGIGGAVCAVDAGDGSGTQYDPEFTLDNGGGYSEPVYRVIVEEGQKDQLKPDRSTATAGSTVTIKVADGVTADDIKVVDKNGKLVEIKKIDDNTYTFVMPASDVNVSGTVEDLRLNDTDHFAYITGYPDGTFKPNGNLTRAEAATIFYRLLTDSTRKAYATTYNSFKDVPATAWYNTAVSTMAKLGIVNGGADGYFRPNDPITRAEIAAMIARCDGAYYTGSSTVFSDTYGHWAAGYIDRAYELGWINGYGTTYAPDRYISRAETVAVLNRVLNRAPQYTSDLTRNYTTFSDVATSAWYYLDVEEAANSHTYTRKSNADYETWTKLIADPSWF